MDIHTRHTIQAIECRVPDPRDRQAFDGGWDDDGTAGSGVAGDGDLSVRRGVVVISGPRGDGEEQETKDNTGVRL